MVFFHRMEVDEFVLPPNVKPAWLMPYLTNLGITLTDNLPTYAGFSRSLGHRDGGQRDGFHGCWLMRFADKKYYTIAPAFRKKGVLPLNKHGHLQTRCAKGRGVGGNNCPANDYVTCLFRIISHSYRKLHIANSASETVEKILNAIYNFN